MYSYFKLLLLVKLVASRHGGGERSICIVDTKVEVEVEKDSGQRRLRPVSVSGMELLVRQQLIVGLSSHL